MRKLSAWTFWLRRIVLLGALIVALPFAVYFGGKIVNRLVLAIDGRSPSPQGALAGMTIYSAFGRKLPGSDSYTIAQRQVLEYPPGILYALKWTEATGRSCLATAFAQEIWDNFGGWKPQGAYGRCDQRRNSRPAASKRPADNRPSVRPRSAVSSRSVWVNGWNRYHGFTVAYGLADDAALVEVAWRDGSVTRAKPINGVFMSVLDRTAAAVRSVRFYDKYGVVIYFTRRLVGY